MTRKIIYIAIIFSLFTSCKSKDSEEILSKGYVIKGSIIGENSKIIYVLDDQFKTLDSVQIINNSFLLTGLINQPQICQLKLKDEEKTYPILLENTEYSLLINDAKVMIIGGLLNTKLLAFHHFKNRLDAKKLSLLDSLKKGVINTDQLFITLEEIHRENKAFTSNFIQKNADNILAEHLFPNTKGYTLAEFKVLKTKINSNENKILDSLLTKEISALQEIADLQLAEELRIAAAKKAYRKPAILFAGDGIHGELVSLSSILKNNKVVLIDFWASWCGPCRMASPSVQRLYNKYKNKGFDILTVSEDKNEEDWKRGIQEDNMQSWHHIFDDYGRISSMYNVRAIPYMVLIDGDGGVIQEKISISQLENELQKILN